MIELLRTLIKELQKLNGNVRDPTTTNPMLHYSIEQISILMDCSKQTVLKWIKDGQLKTFQYKGSMRVRSQHLERFITKYTG